MGRQGVWIKRAAELNGRAIGITIKSDAYGHYIIIMHMVTLSFMLAIFPIVDPSKHWVTSYIHIVRV